MCKLCCSSAHKSQTGILIEIVWVFNSESLSSKREIVAEIKVGWVRLVAKKVGKEAKETVLISPP